MALRLIGSLVLLGWLLVACASARSVPIGKADETILLNPTLTVEAVEKASTSMAGKKVKVVGSFSGWQGKCTGRPPMSRSDWMIESATACVYVSGRLPAELSSVPPARGIGKPIVVFGEISFDNAGKAYLRSERISVSSPQ
jgi:hypothetical protein